MSEKVREILEYGSESQSIDFKMEQYPLGNDYKKHEFLKDISSMANHPDNGDKYIVIGVEEKDGVPFAFHNIHDLIDQANYQQYLNMYIEPQIHFEYRPFEFNGYQLAYFRIFDNKDRPYLVKKELKNAKDGKKIEFREGDGFIRTGTSSRKIVRADFDKMYRDKHLQKDRKTDIAITPTLGYFDLYPSSDILVKNLDLTIENISNRSIDFDIEMKVHKNECCMFLSHNDFQKIKDKNKPSSMFSIAPGILPNFRVSIKEKEAYFIISRTMFQRTKTTMTIAQNETFTKVFHGDFLVVKKDPCKINIEVTVRSDDFTDGALQQEFQISL
jgi:hypothetical protein